MARDQSGQFKAACTVEGTNVGAFLAEAHMRYVGLVVFYTADQNAPGKRGSNKSVEATALIVSGQKRLHAARQSVARRGVDQRRLKSTRCLASAFVVGATALGFAQYVVGMVDSGHFGRGQHRRPRLPIRVKTQSQDAVSGADDFGLGLWGNAEFTVKVHVCMHGGIIKYEYL
jgi:hypothetical protein